MSQCPTNSNENSVVYFDHNAEHMIKHLNRHFGDFDPNKDFLLKNFKPTHRCNPDVLDMIVRAGGVYSRKRLVNFHSLNNLKEVATNHPLLIPISSQLSIDDECNGIFNSYIEDLILYKNFDEFGKEGSHDQEAIQENIVSYEIALDLSDKEKLTIDQTIDQLLELSREIVSLKFGLHYEVDQILKTDQNVFALLGPHYDLQYGDVLIILKREILHHPESYVSPIAGTSFFSGRCANLMPWSKTSAEREDQKNIKRFKKYLLSAAWPDFDRLCAKNLQGLACYQKFKTPSSIHSLTVQDLELYLKKANSHFRMEAHLPSFVPLSLIDHIIIPKALKDSDSVKKLQSLYHKNFVVIQEETDMESLVVSKNVNDLNLKGFFFQLINPEKPIHIPISFSLMKGIIGSISFRIQGDHFELQFPISCPIKQRDQTNAKEERLHISVSNNAKVEISFGPFFYKSKGFFEVGNNKEYTILFDTINNRLILFEKLEDSPHYSPMVLLVDMPSQKLHLTDIKAIQVFKTSHLNIRTEVSHFLVHCSAPDDQTRVFDRILKNGDIKNKAFHSMSLRVSKSPIPSSEYSADPRLTLGFGNDEEEEEEDDDDDDDDDVKNEEAIDVSHYSDYEPQSLSDEEEHLQIAMSLS